MKDGMSERLSVIEKKMSGKSRGPYQSKKANKKQDDVDYVVSDFSVVDVEGETFLELPFNSDRIHNKYRDQFLYVTQGRVPSDWADCFEGALSAAKIEQASFTPY